AKKATMLVIIGIVFTVFVYGLVAGIVKLDDLGLRLRKSASSALQAIGSGIIKAAPYMIRGLAIAGTAAMFLVGGGIVVHGIPALHHAAQAVAAKLAGVPVLGSLAETLFNAVIGIALGGVLVLVITLGSKLFKKKSAAATG